MRFFLVMACLFLAGALYNLFTGDFKEMTGGLVVSGVLFLIYLLRRQKVAADIDSYAESQESGHCCCRCGSQETVQWRAYYLTYSVILYTSRSPGKFRPICIRCKTTAGLPYTFGTFLLGWWGIPFGPIFTIQSIWRNFRGGITYDELESEG